MIRTFYKKCESRQEALYISATIAAVLDNLSPDRNSAVVAYDRCDPPYSRKSTGTLVIFHGRKDGLNTLSSEELGHLMDLLKDNRHNNIHIITCYPKKSLFRRYAVNRSCKTAVWSDIYVRGKEVAILTGTRKEGQKLSRVGDKLIKHRWTQTVGMPIFSIKTILSNFEKKAEPSEESKEDEEEEEETEGGK